MTGEWAVVEKRNHKAIHGIFDSLGRAEHHLQVTIPDYVTRGYFSDKTLTANDFEVIEFYWGGNR